MSVPAHPLSALPARVDGGREADHAGGVSNVHWPRRPWRRFVFLEPQLGPGALLGAHGPLIGAAGVISLSVFGSSEKGFTRVSTYRGRPPGQDELEQVMSYNVTQGPHNMLAFTDGTIPVDGQPVRARVVFVPASGREDSDHWGVLLFGQDYSATISLDHGMTPEQLRLTLKNDTAGYIDIQTVLRNIPPR
jgi:hypothetical protein